MRDLDSGVKQLGWKVLGGVMKRLGWMVLDEGLGGIMKRLG